MVKSGQMFSSTARSNIDNTRLLKTRRLGHSSAVLSRCGISFSTGGNAPALSAERRFVSATSDFRLERVVKGIVMTSNVGSRTQKQVTFLVITSYFLLLSFLIASWINSDVAFKFREFFTEVSKK